MYNYYADKGYKPTLLYSNFHHNKKEKVQYSEENWIAIPTMKYKKNISFLRLVSHIIFSIKASILTISLKPDLVYIAIPPNTAAFITSFFLRKSNAKIIMDVVDLWPETFPFKGILMKVLKPFLNIWKYFRNQALNKASIVLFECQYYKDFLENEGTFIKNSEIIHLSKLTKENEEISIKQVNSNFEELKLCYLGSINHLIDIDLIIQLIILINESKTVIFNIIGVGERKELLISKLIENNISYIDYGGVYDESEKMSIMEECDFAINLYKKETVIGLTYKSIDYFSAGLPIINSIKGDTWSLVQEYNNGFNCVEADIQKIADKIIKLSRFEVTQMKLNTLKLYQEKFSYKVIKANLDRVTDEICNIKGR